MIEREETRCAVSSHNLRRVDFQDLSWVCCSWTVYSWQLSAATDGRVWTPHLTRRIFSLIHTHMRGSRLKSCVCRARITCHDSPFWAHVFVLTLLRLLHFPLFAHHLLSYHPVFPPAHQLHLSGCGGQNPCALSLMRTLAPLPSTTLSHFCDWTSHISTAIQFCVLAKTLRHTSVFYPSPVCCNSSRTRWLLLASGIISVDFIDTVLVVITYWVNRDVHGGLGTLLRPIRVRGGFHWFSMKSSIKNTHTPPNNDTHTPRLPRQTHAPRIPRKTDEFPHLFSISINSLWDALEMKARSPEKFTDVSDVKVTDEDGFLFRSTMIKAKSESGSIVSLSEIAPRQWRSVTQWVWDCSSKETWFASWSQPGTCRGWNAVTLETLSTLLGVEWVHVFLDVWCSCQDSVL